MTIQETTNKDLDLRQLDELFAAVGWKKRGPEKWREVLSKSSHVFSLWDHNRLVGLGRILEDGVMCMLYDIAVHPEYQRRGIGTRIMQHLVGLVKDKNYASIGLFAWEQNPANVPFYEKFGFVRKTSGMELERYMKRE